MTGLQIVPSTIFIGHLGRPPGLNIERQGNRWKRHEAVSAWRKAAAEAWAELDLPPRLHAVTVHVEPHYRTNASRPDTGSCLPAAKAAIDGLVDAHALPADTPDWVRELRFHAPVMKSDAGDGLMVRLAPWRRE